MEKVHSSSVRHRCIGASLLLLLAHLSSMILAILFSLGNQRLTTIADFPTLSLQLHKLDWRLLEEKFLGSHTLVLMSAIGCDRLCFFPAFKLETITSSKLGDEIGLFYLTMLQ